MSKVKAVLVTGASTGIGRKITERLAGDGHFVYACARKDSDLDTLGRIRNVQALRLDVTNPQDIDEAVGAVTRGQRGLYALVNNAGILTLGPVVSGDDNEFDLVMAVNVRGPYSITKAFAPLITAEKGRIAMIGSVAGILAGRNASAYSMSKHALEAFTDSLAVEMEPLEVWVSIIEPADFNTRISKNAIERIGADPGLPNSASYREPDDVAAAVGMALFEPNPKRRYLVVSNEYEARITIEKQIEQLMQLNERHSFSFDRTELIRMLDELSTSPSAQRSRNGSALPGS